MANPMESNSLDMESYNKLPIDYLLIQNYDKGDDYIKMV